MNDQPRNFIISYTGRAGTSALVNTLSRLPRFVIPIFEELDWYYIEQHGLEEKQNPENIHDVVDYMLRNKQAEFPDCSVGFKWRMFGKPERLARVLRNKVIVFNMIRSELLEVVSSLYLTDVVHKEFNKPQFAFSDTNDVVEREEILTRYRLNTVSVDLDAFFALCDKHVATERERIALLGELKEEGVEVYTILYEDFAYRRLYFMDRLLSLLGHPPLATYPTTGLTKISSAYPYELFTNRDELLASPELFDKARQWREVVYSTAFPVVGSTA
jgi:hypothetical protein